MKVFIGITLDPPFVTHDRVIFLKIQTNQYNVLVGERVTLTLNEPFTAGSAS